MYPTIQKGDFIVTYKFPYRIKTPEFYPLMAVPFPFYSKPGFKKLQRNDVLVFSTPLNYERHPSLRMTLVKRLAGLPGDTLYVLKDSIVVNKEVVIEKNQQYIVPDKGFTIELSTENIKYWKRLIRRDGADIEFKHQNQFIINDKCVNEYTFQQNFYFMLGDNKENTIDSRHWGAVPEELIIGRAARIIWRNNQGLVLQKL